MPLSPPLADPRSELPFASTRRRFSRLLFSRASFAAFRHSLPLLLESAALPCSPRPPLRYPSLGLIETSVTPGVYTACVLLRRLKALVNASSDPCTVALALEPPPPPPPVDRFLLLDCGADALATRGTDVSSLGDCLVLVLGYLLVCMCCWSDLSLTLLDEGLSLLVETYEGLSPTPSPPTKPASSQRVRRYATVSVCSTLAHALAFPHLSRTNRHCCISY